MPEVCLSLGFSFEKLFHKVLNPSKLRVFGCLCFPWLRPYSSHKLNPNLVCVSSLATPLLRGPSSVLTPLLKKVFVSRHVKFVENVLSFSSPHPPPPPPPRIAGSRHTLLSPLPHSPRVTFQHHRAQQTSLVLPHHPARPHTDQHLPNLYR